MKKIKKLSFFVTALLIASLAVIAMSVQVSADLAEFDAVIEDVDSGNVLYRTDFDTVYSLTGVSAAKTSLEQIFTKTGGYLQYSRIAANYSGITLTHPSGTIPAGNYKFTGYFRMMYEGELTILRLIINDNSGSTGTVRVYPTSDEWLKVEFYVTLTDEFKSISVNGEAIPEILQAYCIDNFSLVPVSSIPDGYVKPAGFGEKVTLDQVLAAQNGSLIYYPEFNEEFESRYDVQGVVVNLDADSFIGNANNATVAQLRQYARGYGGSHVTDFMICLNNMNSTFPSELETWTDLTDKYFQKVENGIKVDYSGDARAKGAYEHFIVNGNDYIKTFCEAFPEVGINPWISFRMNDLHGREETTSVLLSDYFHENPQYRRVQHGSKSAGTSYYRPALNFTYDPVRERFLDYINEALSRYDCYGIELDFQREIWLWHPGGEYNGIEILNGFMREVEEIVAVYEKKYKHDIKICIRCASDVETNYDFGLDVISWAADGIIDMIIPTGRWSSTDNDIPVALWCSLMHPYGVEVAPCIEIQINGDSGRHTLETYNGAAASYLSQGADKVALYNQYLGGYTARILDKHKVTTEDETVSGTWRHWVIVSTIGSYDKLMTKSRRVILTYNDTYQIWQTAGAQLPINAAPGEVATLRIPFGDVPTGGTVTLKFSVNAPNDVIPPTVYINSKRADFVGTEICTDAQTDNAILCYRLHPSALDNTYAVAQIVANNPLTIDYAEVRVDPAK